MFRSRLKAEARRHLRVKERVSLRWEDEKSQVSGAAIIRNISESGMMLASRGAASVSKGAALAFKPSDVGVMSFLPVSGRVVWSQNNLCGVKFIKPAEETLAVLKERISAKIQQLESRERAKTIVGTILVIIALALIAFVISQQGIMRQQLERSNHLMLSMSNSQSQLYRGILSRYHIQEGVIADMSRDLAATKSMLTQTESVLARIRGENLALKREVTILKRESASLASQFDSANQALVAAAAKPASAETSKTVAQYRQDIRDIKAKIRDVQRRAYEVKVAAQREQDRIELANGNNGYVIKDGQPFHSALSRSASPNRISVDVSFFE